MITMIEQVARAIICNPPKEYLEDTPDGRKIVRDYENTARAAIAAMREPTDYMTTVWEEAIKIWLDDEGEYDAPYKAVIDAALAEKEE